MYQPRRSELAHMRAKADDDRRSWFTGAICAALLLAGAAIGLRIIIRRRFAKRYSLSDVLAFLAAAMLSVLFLSLLVSIRDGMGRHFDQVSNLMEFRTTSLLAQTFYTLCITLIKLSVLFLYLRAFQRAASWFRLAVHSLILVVSVLVIPQCLVFIFQCVPISTLWSSDAHGRCLNDRAALLVCGAIQTITDWLILLLPPSLMWFSKRNTRAGSKEILLFTVGLTACVTGVLRLCYTKNLYNSSDPTWDFVPLFVVSTLHCSIALLAVCLASSCMSHANTNDDVPSQSDWASPCSPKSTTRFVNPVPATDQSIFSHFRRPASRIRHDTSSNHNGIHGLGVIVPERSASAMSIRSLGITAQDKGVEASVTNAQAIQLRPPRASSSYDRHRLSPSRKATENCSKLAEVLPWEYDDLHQPARQDTDNPDYHSQQKGKSSLKYEAKTQVDRWEAMQRGRGRSPTPHEHSFGDLVYGASRGAPARDEALNNSGVAGCEGIVVTSTATVVTEENGSHHQ